jgi:hypothetical protein
MAGRARYRRSLILATIIAVAATWSWVSYRLWLSEPSGGKAMQQSIAPGGRWKVVDYYITEGGVLGVDSGRAVVFLVGDPSRKRTVYFGDPATVRWLDGRRLEFTEEESGARHVVDAQSGSFDSRTDIGINLIWSVAMVALPGVLVLVVGLAVAAGLRRLRLRPHQAAQA